MTKTTYVYTIKKMNDYDFITTYETTTHFENDSAKERLFNDDLIICEWLESINNIFDDSELYFIDDVIDYVED
jgi:hypothetical protein